MKEKQGEGEKINDIFENNVTVSINIIKPDDEQFGLKHLVNNI